MSAGFFNIGLSGINAAQLGLMTTEHNITNANTPGFSRQQIVQTTNSAVATGAGFVGQGTLVSTIQRQYSAILAGQVNTAQTSVSQLTAYNTQISQIDNFIADSNAGLAPALQNFASGVQAVAANPSLASARQSLVSAAQGLTARFQSINTQLTQINAGVNSQITSTVAEINSYAKQVADINQRIIVAQSSSAQPANDLLDQRDQVIASLNKLVGVTTTTNSDGTYNVYFGTGQQLVVGSQATTLTATASTADNSQIVVGIQTGGATQVLPESLITGGSLAGLLNFRSQTLIPTTNEVGKLAASLALTYNAQNALGQDQLSQVAGQGSFVSAFFNVPTPTVVANTANTGAATVSASFVTPPPIAGYYTLANNAGTYTLTRQSDGTQWSGASLAALQAAIPSTEGVTVTGASLTAGQSTTVVSPAAQNANFYTNLTDSDYTLSYNGSSYTLTRLTDSHTWSNASLATLSSTVAASEGFQISASGAMAAGDSFTIQPTKYAAQDISVNAAVAADPRLIAAAMPLRTAASTSNTGAGSITAGVSQLGYSAASIPSGGLTITYNGGNLTFSGGLPAGANISVTVGNTTTVYAAGASIPYNPATGASISVAGLSFNLAGTPNNGDTFTVAQNLGGVTDGRNALALGALQTANTVAGGSASFQADYAAMVSDVGNTANQVQVANSAQTALLQQAQSAQNSLSGVNLDEEAANLLRYQQAYQAAAKVLSVGNKVFDTILAIGG